MRLNIFWCFCWPSVSHSWKNVYSDPLSIFSSGCVVFDVKLHLSYLYILDRNPLSDICRYILPCSRLSLHFIDSCFCYAKAFEFEVVLFIYFCFVSLIWGYVPPKISLRQMSKMILPTSSFRSFTWSYSMSIFLLNILNISNTLKV